MLADLQKIVSQVTLLLLCNTMLPYSDIKSTFALKCESYSEFLVGWIFMMLGAVGSHLII